ncbi:tRNA-splicing endonuclease subunit Sen34 [Desmophyllum pertusum]|uniref:tRNA-splicing endonuclease subunit Sen34 n=1 Tax=Desmophyllum pertusum TaxID=174260 RepID=A0A9W9YSE9_9CNID|nr:tRNA-splicing endonuclease subunit Sen34 [Desmophyllum pertusum]
MADDEGTPVTLLSRFGKVFVWNADDAFKIRSKYRIVGSLIGSLPRKPKQNICFSLPLLLSAEEATLLLDKGLARIFDMPKNLPPPSNEEVKTFNELRRDSVVKQIKLFQRGREEKQKELAEVIEKGRQQKSWRLGKRKKGTDEEARIPVKKVKHEELSNESSEECKTNEERECNQVNVECNDNDVKSNEDETSSRTKDIQANSGTPLTVNTEQGSIDKLLDKSDIPNTSTDLEIDCEEPKFSELGTLIHIPTVMPQRLQSFPPADWTYPQTATEKLTLQGVLRPLGEGILPNMWYEIWWRLPCLSRQSHEKITPFEMISTGRLGATVKKTALICSLSDDTDEVVYTSIKWSGIS